MQSQKFQASLEQLEARQLMSGTSYHVIDLGIVTGVGQSAATLGVNEAGQVYNGKGVWNPGRKMSYSAFTPTGGEKPELFEINDAGYAVGDFKFDGGGFDAALFSPRNKKPYTALKIPALEVNGAKAHGLNNQNHVVGQTYTDDWTGHAFLASVRKGRVYLTDLDDRKPAGMTIQLRDAIDINENGQILIKGGDAGSSVSIRGAVMKTTKHGASVDVLPGLTAANQSLSPDAINNAGLMVGSASIEGFNAFHATLWQVTKKNGPTVKDLGSFGGNKSRAMDINDKGQIVGFANQLYGTERAAIWTVGKKGKYTIGDLNTLAPAKGMTIRYATGINEQGMISAEAIDGNYQQHALLLVPDGASVAAAKTASTATPAAVAAPKPTTFSAKAITQDALWA